MSDSAAHATPEPNQSSANTAAANTAAANTAAANTAAANTAEPSPAADFDAEAIASVFRRAVTLGSERQIELEELDPATMAQIAAEVGIEAPAVAAAIAEHRLGVDHELSLLDRMVGPSVIWAERTSTTAAFDNTERTAAWLEREHGLKSRTRADGVVIATRRDDLAGKVARSVLSMQGRGGLAKVREIRAISVTIEAGPSGPTSTHPGSGDEDAVEGRREATVSAIVVAADVSDRRNGAIGGGVAVSVMSTVLAGSVAIVASPFALLAIPFAVGAGMATSRLAFGSTQRNVRFEVDATIDRIVAGAAAPSMLPDMPRSVSERLRRSGRERRW